MNKYVKVAIRFVVMLVFVCINFWANMQVVFFLKPKFMAMKPDILAVILVFTLFFYVICQMILLMFLLKHNLETSCKKYEIPYR